MADLQPLDPMRSMLIIIMVIRIRIITARNLEYAVCRAWTISPCFSLSWALSREICLGICWNSFFTFTLRFIVHGIAIACPCLFHGVVYQVHHSGQPLIQSALVNMDVKPISSLVEQLGQLEPTKVIFHFYRPTVLFYGAW